MFDISKSRHKQTLGEFCSNWYDRVSQWHDMMLSTFSPQKQMWALHFQNKHKSGSDSTQLLRSVLPIYQKFSLKNMKNVLELEIWLNPMIWFLYCLSTVWCRRFEMNPIVILKWQISKWRFHLENDHFFKWINPVSRVH